MRSKTKNYMQNNWILILLSLSFITHQFYYILKGGNTWDENIDIYGTGKTIEKFKYFITNQEMSEFSNFTAEYFGQLIKLPIYVISKSQPINNIFLEFLQLILEKELLYIESFFYLRHYLLNFYIFISIFIMYYFLNKVTRSVNLTLLVLFFIFSNPIFIGHSMFNSTDIPYAIQLFLASIVYFERFILKKTIDNRDLLLVGIFFGLSLLIRINAIAFLLPLVVYNLVLNFKKLNYKNFFKQHFNLMIVALLTLILGTPGLYIDPVIYIRRVFWAQFQQDWFGYFYMNGNLYLSTDNNFDFLSKVIFYKLPLTILILFLIGLFKLKKTQSHLFKYSYFFLLYTIIAHIIFSPVTYNYFRHYLFLIPFLSLSSGFVLYDLIKNRTKQFQVFTLLFVAGYILFTQTGLEQYKYVYLNELVDEKNISVECSENYELNGCGYWQTDYYGFSGKETINLVENLSFNNVYICDPTFTYGMYIHDNKFWEVKNGNPDFDDYGFWDQYQYLYQIEHLSEYIEQNSTGSFYALAIHAPGYKTCKFDKLSFDFGSFNCHIIETVKRRMRGTSFALNYVHLCEYSL